MAKLGFGFLVLGLTSLSVASGPSSARTIIEQKENGFIKAMKNKDISWFQNNSTSDFKENDSHRSYDKAQSLAQMKQLFAVLKSTKSITSKILSFQMQGKNAVVKSQTHMVVIIGGPQGKTMTLDDLTVGKEVWVPAGGSYKIKSLQQLSDKTLLNGKPFKGQM